MILLFYRFIEFLVRLGLPMYFSDIVVVGKDNIPQTGPMVMILKIYTNGIM
jgi:1-acyl-sn-glycerol-3-phosphate acyltransferase